MNNIQSAKVSPALIQKEGLGHKLAFHVVTAAIRGVVSVLCRVQKEALKQVPLEGPFILAINHINFMDAPVLFPHLQPRKATGLIKIETWDNPFFGALFTLWGGIPVHRGEADMQAFRLARAALAAGKILVVAPEGTRSGDGKLKQGRGGLVLLAEKAQVPIMPLAFYGSESFWQNLSSFRRTDFKIVVGSPFRVDTHGSKLSSALSQEIADEVMYQLAALLPGQYRGVYSDLSKATQKYLSFEAGTESNLAISRSEPTLDAG